MTIGKSTQLIGFAAVLFLASCSTTGKGKPGEVLDEARRANRDAASLPAADEDYFHDMDGGISLTRDEAMGRNTWLVWTGGNDVLWDNLTTISFGALDFLKTLSSHPSLKFSRDNRWNYLGPGK